MKHLILYLMLLIAVPATAQSGLFGRHPNQPQPTEGHHHHGSLMHHGPLDHPKAMNPDDFQVAHRYISKEIFDSKRLDLAKHIVERNWFNARQIASICELFSYDSNRLEFAKFAYSSCVDKGLYFLVEETFTFSSSKEELRNYITKDALRY